MSPLYLASLWLTFCSILAASLSYPANIEVDLLFPRNETYNNLTSFPVVLAVQNVDAAYKFSWDITWKMFNASPGASEYDQMNGYGSFSDLGINKFQYYFDDVAVVPMLGYNFTRMEAGPYRLEWEYVVSPCTHEPPNTIVYNINQVVASGMHYFSVVEDGSGLDFDIPTNECPLYGDTWSVKDATYTYCPFLGDDTDVEKKPCDAKLQNSDQVECIKEFLFEGTAEVPNNRTETCSAFKRADPKWLEYEDENDDEDRGDEDGGDEDGGDEDGGAADSSGSSTHDGNDDENSAGGLQLSMFSIAVAGILAIMEL